MTKAAESGNTQYRKNPRHPVYREAAHPSKHQLRDEIDLHKESLRKLHDESDSRIRAIATDTLVNEATCSDYVYTFIPDAGCPGIQW